MKRYSFDDLVTDQVDVIDGIGRRAEEIERLLSHLCGDQLAAWGDRIADPMRTLLEMRSVAMLTDAALKDAERLGHVTGPRPEVPDMVCTVVGCDGCPRCES